MTLDMDSGKEVSFDPRQMRHFDHGYAVTSYSSQGLTSERVFAQVFTNDAITLAESLSRDVSKTSALEFGRCRYLSTTYLSNRHER
jgi:ATP-dependent exoDNAse (exonuclease V) alpha subunit